MEGIMKPVITKTTENRGFTLIECVIAVAVCAILMLATISALIFARTKNEIEQERTRAHQIVTEWLEVNRFQLFTFTSTLAPQVIWGNNTTSTSDDTNGTLEVEVRNAATGAILTSTTMPNPAVMTRVEATITWKPRGVLGSGRTQRETVMTYKAP